MRCTLPATQGSAFCWNHDPERTEERSRNASDVASLKHSRVGQEIRDVREMTKELILATVSNELHPKVRKELQSVVQLLLALPLGPQLAILLTVLSLKTGSLHALPEVARAPSYQPVRHNRGYAAPEGLDTLCTSPL